jgi:hypothetical protein
LLLVGAGLSGPVLAQAPAPSPTVSQPSAPSPSTGPVQGPGGFGQSPGLGLQPGYGYGLPPVVSPPPPGQTQTPEMPPATGEQPIPPGAPSPVPVLVPVIPDVRPPGPPSTIPSAPQRVLPALGVGLPVTATFQFEPTLSVLEEYTDNFNLTKSNKESNFRTSISPGFRLGINSPLTKGLITYMFSPAYDTALEDFSLFHSVLGQIVWQANPRWQLTLADTFIRSDQPGDADRLGLRQERRTFQTNTFSATSQYLIDLVTTRLTYRLVTFEDDDDAKTTSHGVGASASLPLYQTNLVSLGYDYITTKSTEGSGGVSTGGGFTSTGDFDLDGHQLSASASRRISPLTAVGLKGSYALRYATSETSGDTDYQLWTASLFTSYTLPGRLTFDGSGGVSGLSTDSGDSRGPLFFTASSLAYEFGQATFRLVFDRGFSETFSEGENFGVVETLGVAASVTYRFTPFISATGSGAYRKNKTTGIGNDPAQDEKTKNWGGSLLVSWRMLRFLLLDLTYSYFHQVGSDTGTGAGGLGDTYTENRVQAAFRFTF